MGLLGGLGWWMGASGAVSFHNPFDPGPLRVNYKFEKIPLTPYDVSRGYDWGIKAGLEHQGRPEVPAKWTRAATHWGYDADAGIYYKINGSWKKVSDRQAINVTSFVQANLYDEGTNKLEVRLGDVPLDASEVHLRGLFLGSIPFKGPVAPGWKPPPNITVSGARYDLNVSSQPFDIVIKGPDEPMPTATVSRIPYLQLVSSGWYGEPGSRFFGVRLRDTSVNNVFQKDLDLKADKLSLRDAEGKIVLLNGNGGRSGGTEINNVWPSRLIQPPIETNEMVFYVSGENEVPNQNWKKAKLPLRLEAEVSDGISWPLKLKIDFTPPPQ
ncbi:hypothetical protein EON80_06490 [bacterium]|nr:MAG: hypothetical protein EON80_06490 [bacterium]